MMAGQMGRQVLKVHDKIQATGSFMLAFMTRPKFLLAHISPPT
jgi:hypothetical protein